MNEQLNNALKGFGSYVSLIVMVWFAMANAPVWMTLFVSLSLGWASYYLIFWAVAFFVSAYNVSLLLHDMQYGKNKEEVSTEMFDAYLAYVYEQAKLSTLR